jgi:dTDP-glucose pyrophosphorylase
MSRTILKPTATLFDAVRTIEASTERLAIVVSSEDNRLLGTLTDGDIRRHILKGHNLQSSVTDVMNTNPVTANVDTPKSLLYELLERHNIRGIPLVDTQHKFISTVYRVDLDESNGLVNKKIFSAAVIMAGGEGTRLRPITKKIPKPMIEIDGVPLLERQINNLHNMGISSIHISVNYLSDIIKDHFGNGEKYGVEINYLDEIKKLGTAGSLCLVPELTQSEPILVMNGDILTTSDFSHLYDFHEEHQSDITMCAVDYHVDIPFGVIQNDGVKITSLQEKPSQRFFCNAGIYVLSPQIIKEIPTNKFLNMTDVIEQCMSAGGAVSVFPLHEYWTDIGTHADLAEAKKRFEGN